MSEAVSFNVWDLPKDWKVDYLENITQKITDGSHFSPAPQEDGEIIVNVKDMGQYRIKYEDCTRITKKDFDVLVAQNCSPQSNDVLLSKDGTIGRVLLFDGSKEVVLLSSIAIIRPNFGIVPRYLRYVLSSFIFTKQLYSLQSGSALKRIVLGDIKRLRVPYPELVRQEKIANILTTVDNLIEKTEALIEKYQAIKQGMMHDLFTRGIDSNGQLRPSYHDAPHLYKQTEIGLMPRDWELVTINDLAIRVGSGITPTGGSEIYTTEGVVFLRSQNVTFEGLKLDDVAYIDWKTHKSMIASEIYAFDVLINITGASIGRCCYLPEGLGAVNTNQHVCAIRFENPTKEKAIYLSKVLSSYIGQNQIFRLNAGGNREGLNYQQLRSFRIPWPKNEDEVSSITSQLVLADAQVNKNKKSLDKYRLIKKGLMQDLLTGKVRVK